jgi:hypothetical protein
VPTVLEVTVRHPPHYHKSPEAGHKQFLRKTCIAAKCVVIPLAFFFSTILWSLWVQWGRGWVVVILVSEQHSVGNACFATCRYFTTWNMKSNLRTAALAVLADRKDDCVKVFLV